MSELPDTPWTQLDKLIADYVDGYEVCDCEDANGNTGDYSPTEFERGMILDAIHGLIGDDEIVAKLIEATEYTKAYRRAAGECESCGHVLPGHWGACSGMTQKCDSGEKPCS